VQYEIADGVLIGSVPPPDLFFIQLTQTERNGSGHLIKLPD
jgi:hypothetical protein